MSDSEVSVKITGEAVGAVAAMQEATVAVKEGVASMRESLATVNESFRGVSEAFLAFGALLAGGGMFKEAISSTQDWVESSIQLSIELGISTEKAAIYHVAIKEVGGSVADFDAAVRGVTRQLRTHEKGMNDVGIATRNSAGRLLDYDTILWNAINTVNSYAAGTDRNLAAQIAFGRGVTSTSAVLRLHKENMDDAAETTKKLALIVGEYAVDAFEANRKSLADTSLKFDAMKIQLGNELIPAIVKLGEAFGGNATTAGQVLADVITFMGQAVLALVGGVKEWIATFEGLGDAASAVLKGQFSQVSDIYDQTMAKIHQIDTETDAAIAKLGQKNAQQDWGLSGGWDDDKKKPDKNLDLPAPKEKGPDNRLALFKNALEEMSQARGDFDKKDIAADLAYWEALQANTVAKTKEDVKLKADIAREILSLKKKMHDEEIKQDLEYFKTVETLELGEISAKEVAAQQAVALGNITNAQLIQLERQFEAEKFAVKQKTIQDQLSLNRFDLAGQQKLKDEELVLEQKHAADVQKIVNKEALDQKRVWDSLFKSMESGFQQTIQGFLNGTQTLGATIKGLFSDIANSIIQSIAQMAAQWLAKSVEQIVIQKTTAQAVITSLAAQAAAGAFAATAAIPYIGPELAPGAAALAYADTMAYGALAIAAQGYDIPGDVNPITQLHRNEMVLPAKYANVIRGMAAGQGGGGMTVNISAVDARSLQRALTGTGGSGPLAVALKGLNTRFVGA